MTAIAEETPDVKQIIQQMQEWQEREGPTLGPGLTIRELREEGRRFWTRQRNQIASAEDVTAGNRWQYGDDPGLAFCAR